jgi:hypothetical protein
MRNPFSSFREKTRARRKEWQTVLAGEVKKWSAIPYYQIQSKVRDSHECYEVQLNSKKYQVEVEILENTEEYLHVGLSLDDGSLPASIRPVSSSIIVYKGEKEPTP